MNAEYISSIELERANQFWARAKAHVEEVAKANGIDLALSENDDEFLFELFENGDYIPASDGEILEAILEFVGEEG